MEISSKFCKARTWWRLPWLDKLLCWDFAIWNERNFNYYGIQNVAFVKAEILSRFQYIAATIFKTHFRQM